MKIKKNLTPFFRYLAAAILLQTLYFKFSGAEESVYIFSKLGAEPLGRFASGIVELIVAILLLIPATQSIGALGGIGVMSGALLSHLLILGIVVKNDGALLFSLALVVLFCSVFILFKNLDQLKILISKTKRFITND